VHVESDSELVAAALNGDQQAFGRLFQRHERSVLAVTLSILGNYHAAQDAAQEAFVTAYTRIGSLREGACFGPWVCKIARREAIRVGRRTRPRPEAARAPVQTCSPSDNGQIDESHRQLLDAVTRLPRHEQEVLVLHYFEGHAVKAISEMTGRPVGTITMQLSRGRSRLQRVLKETQT
jgi:RNA polymerase sigma-70 factor (ECF subfamily)